MLEMFLTRGYALSAHLADGTTNGTYRRTPETFQNAANPGWRNVKPWTMATGSQYRVPPPPALDSDLYKRSYLEGG